MMVFSIIWLQSDLENKISPTEKKPGQLEAANI